MMRRFIAIAIAGTLAMTSASAADRKYANVHTVAVVSALGGAITVNRLGFRWNANEYKLPIEWELDAQLTRQATAILAKHFVVNEVDPKTLIPSGPESTELNSVRERIASMPKMVGVDAYVVILPDPAEVSYGEGAVVTRDPGLFGGGNTILGLHYKVWAIYASSGKVIDFGTAENPASENIFGSSLPFDTCDNSLWSDSVDSFSVEQKASLRKEFAVLASRSIGYTLANAGLIDKPEAQAATATFDITGDKACRRGR